MNASIAIAAGLGLVLTVAGALGAHAIPAAASELRTSWDSALLFGFVHVLAAIGARILSAERPLARYAAWTFLLGVFAFSLAIIISTALKASAPAGAEAHWLSGIGSLAPVGGIAFMLGWALLALAALRPSSA